MKYSKIIVAVALSAMALTGCGDTTPKPVEQSTDQPSGAPATTTAAAGPATTPPAAVPEADGSASRPFDFGVFALSSPSSRWDVTLADTVVTDGTSLVVAENPYNEVKEGWDYVLGRMSSVMNEKLSSSDAGKPVSPTSVMPVFIGSDGRIYEIWNNGSSAVVLKDAWVGQPDIIAKAGIESTGRFAIQVPSTAIPGGRFATRNQVEGTVVYFGEPVQ